MRTPGLIEDDLCGGLIELDVLVAEEAAAAP